MGLLTLGAIGNYFIYITTNPRRTALYTGMTNDLIRRLYEHYENRGQRSTFAGRFYCYKLVYYERCKTAKHALDREKEIKKWNRKKKEQLIRSKNPGWRFLNEEI